VHPSRLCPYMMCPHLLLLLVGLASCGPVSSDNAPSVGSGASVTKSPLSTQGPAPGINSLTQVVPSANPGSLASANGTGAVADLAVPARMTKELASPNVALETLAQSAPPGAVDPLIQAFNDKDERQVGAAAWIEEQEYQDPDPGQENQDPDEGQANQDPDEKGEK
jgi:hypothetical protein